MAAARDGDVVYAVPGSPFVAEDTVARVLALADEAGVAVHVVPAMSYVDAVASSLRVDLGDIQLCDALDLRIDAERPALISQLFDRDSSERSEAGAAGYLPGRTPGHRGPERRDPGSGYAQPAARGSRPPGPTATWTASTCLRWARTRTCGASTGCTPW
ncbi:MAG: SAM-dependent methyltransferase [Dehalococcoidia bacterium]|nr:SAM-dependent methyltransferase [Dehalococcoidia bacterium]